METQPTLSSLVGCSVLLAVGEHVQVVAGVYKGRSGIVQSVGKYWHQVKPDQNGVGGLNPRGCMVIGAESEWAKTANDEAHL